MDDGIDPVRRLSAKLSTLSFDKLPMFDGIGPERSLPIKSRTRSFGNEEMQAGIEPDMPFQSAIMSVVSESILQTDEEMDPVMYPVLPIFSKMGSSDSPRRFTSATR